MKKFLSILTTLCVLVALLVAFAPLPRRLDKSFQGQRIAAASTQNQGDPAEMQLKGWYLDFFFMDDRLMADMTLSPFAGNADGKRYQVRAPVYSFYGKVYDVSISQNEVPIYIAFTEDFSQLMVEDGEDTGYFYVMADGAASTSEDAYKRFSPFFGMKNN